MGLFGCTGGDSSPSDAEFREFGFSSTGYVDMEYSTGWPDPTTTSYGDSTTTGYDYGDSTTTAYYGDSTTGYYYGDSTTGYYGDSTTGYYSDSTTGYYGDSTTTTDPMTGGGSTGEGSTSWGSTGGMSGSTGGGSTSWGSTGDMSGSTGGGSTSWGSTGGGSTGGGSTSWGSTSWGSTGGDESTDEDTGWDELDLGGGWCDPIAYAAPPAACNALTTIEQLISCKVAMGNPPLTTFLGRLISHGKLPAANQATCSNGSAQPASCGNAGSPDNLRAFINHGNLILSVNLDDTANGSRIEVGQKGIPGRPANHMKMADIDFSQNGTAAAQTQAAYIRAYGDEGCEICHSPSAGAVIQAIQHTPPGETEVVTTNVVALPPITLTANNFGDAPWKNTAANERSLQELNDDVCFGSYLATDYCDRVRALLGLGWVPCSLPTECDENLACADDEHWQDCPLDCPAVCGNSVCDNLAHENATNCAYDC